MLKAQKCKKCGGKIKKKYNFCPICGNKIFQSHREDYGLLGKEDTLSQELTEINLPFGLNKLAESLINSLSKEFDFTSQDFREDKLVSPKNQKKGIKINISTFGNNPKIRVSPLVEESLVQGKKNSPLFKNKFFTKDQIESFSKLKKEDPKTGVRRFSDSMIYEIEMPEVVSLEDISIVQLENSIEIKGIGKKISYVKLIPLGLSIKKYEFLKGKLILELANKN